MKNEQMNSQVTQVQRALKRLEELDITVTSVVMINNNRPMIFIKPSQECRKLDSGWIRTKAVSTTGNREVDRVSMVADCQVRWTENVTPNQARRLS